MIGLYMSNEQFTPPPSPVVQTPQLNQIPEEQGGIQGNGNRPEDILQGDASSIDDRGNRTAAQSIVHAEPTGNSGGISGVLLSQPGSIQNENTPEDLNDRTPEQIESDEVENVKKSYKLTPKFNRWCELYLDKKNKDTYLNKTRSALQAYSLDETTEYAIAGSMGYQNFKKLQNVASQIADRKDYNLEKWLDVGWLQMLKSQSPEWWDRIGDMLGFRDLKPQLVVQQNTQNNTIINATDEQKKSFNEQFRSFIKNT
jgi:hypothetical protein